MFRVLFGFMMCFSIGRFAYYGWIDELYIQPKFYFTYLGFEWVKPFGTNGMYLLFFGMFLASFMVMLGLFYRIASIFFFLTFTYIELIDKTNYLNHYYFISIVAFLMCFLPAHRYFSLDVLLRPKLKLSHIPKWNIDAIKLQLGIVYFFAGVAKINADWLFEAMPLKMWLPARASDFPVIGFLMDEVWVAYFFSWLGCIYDLLIPFFLLSKKYRPYAYFFVIAFHVLTWMLFNIGMFPFIMIVSTLIFFDAEFHQKIIDTISKLLKWKKEEQFEERKLKPTVFSKIIIGLFVVHFTIQVLVPFRYTLYPGKLFWTEEGYRFSWRVMLMEKGGVALFYVSDQSFSGEIEIMNSDYLTPQQEKMMSTQPDMILQFAHHLRDEYKGKVIEIKGQRFEFSNPTVRVESYVTLNGSGTKTFIEPNVDLAQLDYNLLHRNWVIPFER